MSDNQQITVVFHAIMAVCFVALACGKTSSFGIWLAYIAVVVANIFGALQIVFPVVRLGEPVMYACLGLLFVVCMVWTIQLMFPKRKNT